MDVKRILKILSTSKVSEHIRSGFSMSTISYFISMKNKHDMYRLRENVL